MMKQKPSRLSISGRMYLSVLLLIILTILLTGIVCFQYALNIKNEDRDTLITDIAEMVSELPEVKAALRTGKKSDHLQTQLDTMIKGLSQLDVLVVCDPNSIRLYHSEPSRIGDTFIGGDEGSILEGAPPYISIAVGSLGLQRRAFHAVTEEDGTILGFVMASVLNSSISQVRASIIRSFLLLLITLLVLGSILAAIFRYRLESIFRGYKPEEFANLYIEREEVLDALEEGLFAINTQGEILLMNASAKRMLDLPPDEHVEGRLLRTYYPETMLPNTVVTGNTEHNIHFQVKGRHIISSRIPIRRKDRIIGAVSIFRNKTEVTKLAEELTGANYMVDTLRSANHEFTNKLHVILGLLEMKEVDQAKNFILNTNLVSGQAIRDIQHRVPIASLAALIIGKMMRASELGISFVLKSDSYFRPKQNELPSDCYITLVGNLVENAMDELNSSEKEPKQIELGIYAEEGHTTITCDDTGGGIPEEILFSIYDPHTTTKGPGHGTGFALMKQTVDRYEGIFHIDTEPGEGTSIEINLPI